MLSIKGIRNIILEQQNIDYLYIFLQRILFLRFNYAHKIHPINIQELIQISNDSVRACSFLRITSLDAVSFNYKSDCIGT